MSQARHTASRLLPVVGITTAGVAASAAGLWAWRGRNAVPENRKENGAVTVGVREESTAVAVAVPKAPIEEPLERIGPMVAVYLDQASVKKLEEKYPETAVARLQKVVIQYDPSEKQRGLYEPHFGGLATVQLTGKATSADRHALMASVSLAGKAVEPQSLSCAVDVTPGNLSGGPLGSAALIEQIKRAGAAAKDVPWKGSLPPLSAHGRDYPSEDGCYDKLDAPLTVTGSVCRADWVEGTTGRCRTLTAGGDKRTDGWTPQGCIICNTLEASPCRDTYKIYERLSARIKELEALSEASSENGANNVAGKSEGGDDQDSAATQHGASEGGENSALGSNGEGAGIAAADGAEGRRRVVDEAGGEGKAEGGGEGGGGGEGEAEGKGRGGAQAGRQGAEEGKFIDGEKEEELREEDQRDAELCKLDAERTEAMIDMMRCSSFHSVMEDWTADAGVTHGEDEDDDDDDDDVVEAGGQGSEGGGAGGFDGGAPAEGNTADVREDESGAKK